MTIFLILITCIVSFIGFTNEKFMLQCINYPYGVVHHKQYYRLITGGFVHLDYWHLGFNMLALYFFGQVVEQILVGYYSVVGYGLYFGIYLIAVIVSDIPITIEKQNDHGYTSLGASGGTAALMLASVILSPMSNICLYFVICLPSVVFAILFIAYSYYGAYYKQNDSINHSAHLYGGLIGLVFIAIVPNAYPDFFSQIQNVIGNYIH